MKTISNLKIIGISIRTTNHGGQSQEDIGKLWAKFYEDNLIEKIPNKVSNDIYSVYTNYKSNYQEEYTAIIGVAVDNLDIIPEGCTGQEFPTEKFKIFTAKGEMPKRIMDTWLSIWHQEKGLKRKYTYDFERYISKPDDEENPEVEVYISVK